MTDRLTRLAHLMVAGTPADDPAVLAEIDWYYRLARRFGIANADMFTSNGAAVRQ